MDHIRIASNYFEFIWCELRSFLLLNKFMKMYFINENTEIQNIVHYLKSSPKLKIFPYEFVEKYKNISIDVYKDLKSGKFYSVIYGKSVYLSKKYNLKFLAKRYIKNLLIEQDIESPHCYLSDSYSHNVGGILFDVGAAEGAFSLQVIDKFDEIYIFECNDDWIDALHNTFANYKSKVHIVKAFISNSDTNDTITLDTFARNHGIINRVSFIKMDIEGYEELALEGASEIIKSSRELQLVICTYHLQNQEKNIKIKLNNFEFEIPPKYMIYYYDFNIKHDFLRHGVLRAWKNDSRATELS